MKSVPSNSSLAPTGMPFRSEVVMHRGLALLLALLVALAGQAPAWAGDAEEAAAVRRTASWAADAVCEDLAPPPTFGPPVSSGSA